MTEKPIEQQKSLGREIFDNLLATGAKLAATTRPQLRSKSTDNSGTSISNMVSPEKSMTKSEEEEEKEVTEEKEHKEEKEEDDDEAKHVIGEDSSDEEDLSPDVLEEVDRLLKEYSDEE